MDRRHRPPGEACPRRRRKRAGLLSTHGSACNVRFNEKRILAVYDWDSLALVKESTALGQAGTDLVGHG